MQFVNRRPCLVQKILRPGRRRFCKERSVSKKKKSEEPLPVLGPGVSLVDTHCHLEMGHYEEDRQAVIDRALSGGVGQLITIGIDLESSRQAISLAESDSRIFATVGVHPHHVAGLGDEEYRQLRELAVHPRVVGFGEIGIDLVKDYAPPSVQEEHFRCQLELARELELPVVIHDREAHGQVMAALTELGPFPAGGVMHCFSGDVRLARQVVELGFYVSIPGVVTFNKAEDLQETVRELPLSSLLLETDAPYLAPVPKRGKRNEPLFTLYTARKVAELKGVSLDEVARSTTANAARLFGLGERRAS